MYYMRMSKAENVLYENVLYENVLYEIMQPYMACGGGKKETNPSVLFFSYLYSILKALPVSN